MSRRATEPDPYTFGSRPYDLVKEFVIALAAVAVLTVILASAFSSPDIKPMTLASWANSNPADFTATALSELDATSTTAGYGPPYNAASTGQKLGPLALAQAVGVTHPIDTADAFVLQPLTAAPQTPAVTAALSQWRSANPGSRSAWSTSYASALNTAGGDPGKVASGTYGPVPVLLSALSAEARSGALDGALQYESGFYRTDYTLPLMFLADGSDLSAEAHQQHLAGTQWGMMNEVGDFPGQVWLAPYTFWYQIQPYRSSGNGDALVWGTMGLVVGVFVFLPFIPGLRSLPRAIPVYRLIWRDFYRTRT